MQERFDIEFKEDCIVELDSSTPAKFSRHVIVRIPGAAFQSNFHVGAFVKDLCEPPGSAESPDSPERAPRQEFLIHKVRPLWVTVSETRVSPHFSRPGACLTAHWSAPMAVCVPCMFKDDVTA